MTTITVTVTAEDIAAGFEATMQSPKALAAVCPLARAISRETLRAAAVLKYSWHAVVKDGPPVPGFKLPADAIAFVAAFDAKVEEERAARAREAAGGTFDRRLQHLAGATFNLAMPS